MKDQFSGYYSESEESLEKAWKADGTLFIFDTNTLLNLYGYADKTREDFFAILNKITKNIWIPHQVALEYQRRRLDVIKEEKSIFTKIEHTLKKFEALFSEDFKKLDLDRRIPELHQETTKLESGIKKLIEKYKANVEKHDANQPCVRSEDKIRERLDSFFSGKVGPIPVDQKHLDEIYKEGAERYKNKIPPGFEDDGKSQDPNNIFQFHGLSYQRQYGDLILWKQIISKGQDEKIEAIIFITDDAKKDWWEIIDSRGKKKIGPRPELKEEIITQSKVNIFHMYSTADFLELGSKVLKIKVSPDSVSDAEQWFKVEDTRHNDYESYLALINKEEKINKTIKNKYSSSLLSKYLDQESYNESLLRQYLSSEDQEALSKRNQISNRKNELNSILKEFSELRNLELNEKLKKDFYLIDHAINKKWAKVALNSERNEPGNIDDLDEYYEKEE